VTDIAQGLDPDDLVIVESTLPPGTTETVLGPLIESESGLNSDEFGLAFCRNGPLAGARFATSGEPTRRSSVGPPKRVPEPPSTSTRRWSTTT